MGDYLGFVSKLLVDKIPLASSSIVLDAGCGYGSVLSYLLEKGITVYGLDISSQNLIRNELKNYFVKSDAHHLPFKDGAFDAIFAFEMVEHLNMPDKFLKEAKRTLKTRAILVIAAPTPASKFAHNSGHISVYERSIWISKLKALGFEVNIMTPPYVVGSVLPSIFSKILTQTLGRVIGYWKRYIDVTSTKLLCTKM